MQVPPQRSELKETLMLSIPTFFDLLATVLMNVGLLWVTASVYQMMRGAEMLFAAFFAVAFLKRSLNKWHYGGLLCCIVGISLVGSASLLSGEGSATQKISQEQMVAGMTLIIVSQVRTHLGPASTSNIKDYPRDAPHLPALPRTCLQAVQAAQLTFEDFFMADLDVAPMRIVGWEGMFGTIATLLFIAPIAYYMHGTEGEGFHEDIVDTWVVSERKEESWT